MWVSIIRVSRDTGTLPREMQIVHIATQYFSLHVAEVPGDDFMAPCKTSPWKVPTDATSAVFEEPTWL